jgi:hypothetical protein
MAQIAGEGIDLDADADAHADPSELHAPTNAEIDALFDEASPYRPAR